MLRIATAKMAWVGRMRRCLGLFAALLGALAAVLAAPTVASAATTETFNYTGGVQTWTVPAGVTSASFDIYGASGGESSYGGGGKGGRALSDLTLTPGSTVYIVVGGAGAWPGAGYNGGGYGVRFGGGGATDIRIGGLSLNNRVLVAGGGGGAGNNVGDSGGNGGGLTGTGASGGFGGGGGTQTAGGSGTYPDWEGSFGQGGTNGGVNMTGGGGGGWYGGGGGPGGGGGGSGYGPAGTSFQTGVRAGNGTASITIPERTLTVATRGTFPGPAEGRGYIQSSPAGIDCGYLDRAACSKDYLRGTPVTLTATAFTGWTFVRWDGDCSGTTPTCDVSMEEARNVQAVFEITRIPLTVTKPGNGSGLVTSDPAGIDCGSTCTKGFLDYQSVTLTAAADTGSDFTGWDGDCSGTSTSCTVSMAQARDVEARFTLQKRGLSVSRTGNGSGSITSSPAGLNCGSTCSADFDYGTPVTLTANPATGSAFTGWGLGACQASGTSPTCTVTMDQARTAQAGFTLEEKRTLLVTKSATGTGTVTSDPAGIDCGSTCSEDYDYGTEVTLTATPGPNSEFGGWSGACSGAATSCTVAMSQARTVDAAFPLEQRTLSASKSGNGSGTVTSAPAGIDCGSSCSADYDHGTSVTLTANVGSNSDFGGWSGACSGSSPTCTIAMNQARSVEAYFTLPAQATLTNGGFETGDLSGWTTAGVPNGTATAETSFTCPHGNCFDTTVSPVEGSKFALLTPGDLDVYTAVSQTFTAEAGEKISGQARFLSQEVSNSDFNDQGQVVIKDASNNEVIAFSAGSNTTNSTPWTYWQRTFSVAGTYTVEARVKNAGLPGSPSRLALDKVSLEDADTTAPQLNLPADITEVATGPEGAPVSWQAPTATDENPANPQVSCDADSGDTFPIGTTTVNCSATDAAGNTASGSFTVTVQDATAPKISISTPTGKGIARGTNVAATFSEKMSPASITKSTFKLFKVTSSGTTQVTNGTVTLSSNGLKATLNPFGTSSTLLDAGTRYKAVVTTGARDLAGNALDQNSTKAGNQQKAWTFTTKG